jgi:hypothetical protein
MKFDTHCSSSFAKREIQKGVMMEMQPRVEIRALIRLITPIPFLYSEIPNNAGP